MERPDGVGVLHRRRGQGRQAGTDIRTRGNMWWVNHPMTGVHQVAIRRPRSSGRAMLSSAIRKTPPVRQQHGTRSGWGSEKCPRPRRPTQTGRHPIGAITRVIASSKRFRRQGGLMGGQPPATKSTTTYSAWRVEALATPVIRLRPGDERRADLLRPCAEAPYPQRPKGAARNSTSR